MHQQVPNLPCHAEPSCLIMHQQLPNLPCHSSVGHDNSNKLRDAMCEVNGGLLFINCTDFYLRKKETMTSSKVHRDIQTVLTCQLDKSLSSFSIVKKLTSKIFQSTSKKSPQLHDYENCFQFLDVIPSSSYSYCEPEVVTWIKARKLPDVSILITVAMYDKLDDCMLKAYLKKRDINLRKHYAKTINPVTELYNIDNKFIVVIRNQNKTGCNDLIHLMRTFLSVLHLRKPRTFQLALDVSCCVNRLDNVTNFITNIKSSNVKWILLIPINYLVTYKLALSSRWIVDIPSPRTNVSTVPLSGAPTYYSEQVEDYYYRNSIKEILHYMKFSDNFTCDRLSRLYDQSIKTLPFSASSLISVKVYVFDNCNQSYIEDPASDHQWGFDGRSLVQFDPENNRFTTCNRYILCSSATEIMLDQKIFERINHLNLPLDKPKPEIIAIQGVPGCGKSTWILNSHEIGKDLVLSSSRQGINDFKCKIEEQCLNAGTNYDDIKTNYRTIASYLLHGIKKYDTVYIDEYLMVHAGLLGLVALLSECRIMFILGDQNQIPYIDRLHYMNMQYYDANKCTTSSKHLNLTYRCPADVVYSLQCIYHTFNTTNTCTRSVKFLKCFTIADIPVLPNTLYLTFTKSEKRQVNSRFVMPETSRVLTIHEAQGLTSPSVICIRLSRKKLQLFESLPHVIVALTRHTQNFVYYSTIEGDQLHLLIRTASSANYGNLKQLIVKADSGNATKEEIHRSTPSISSTKNTFYFQNVNKMSSKASHFYNFVLMTQFPIYIICETSFNETILSSEFFPSDYEVYRCDRSKRTSNKKSGGGVLIAVQAKLHNELHEISNHEIEQLCVKISINNRTTFVFVAYIPPDSPTSSYIACCDTIMEINNTADPSDIILITGDFNLPNITWRYDEEMDQILPLNSNAEKECLFIDTVLETNLSQICMIQNGRDRILDLIFTNEPLYFTTRESSSPFIINDINHKAIEIIMQCDGNDFVSDHLNRKPYYNFRKADSSKLCQYFEQIDWVNELRNDNIDINVNKFNNILLKGLESFVPLTFPNLKNYPPWYDEKLINLKNKKDKAYKKSLKFYSEMNKLNFIECKHNFECYFELKYNEYISSIKHKIRKDPKHFWSYFKTKRNSHGYPTCMAFNGRKTCDPQVISNMFASFFQSVYKPEDIEEFRFLSHGESNLSVDIPRIEINDIYLALESFGDGCGPDGIPASLLKDYTILAIPLCLLFNQSLQLAKFPQVWKTTKITPIFKTGAKSDVSCYRGITSISSVPKLFELVVCNSFKASVSRNISLCQHGFIPRRSTSTNLIEFTSYCMTEIESHKQVDVIYTDFAKAFDSISHSKTLECLYKFGFSFQFVSWFKSYLVNRIQYVEFGNKRSNIIRATSGVPQGSHAGPWLFIIFINGITEIIRHSKLLMFADDIKIYRTIETISDTNKLQEDIDNLVNWCETYHLSLNINKCKTLSFHRKVNPVICDYHINGICLEKVFEIKDLGVTFVENMGFSKHIEQSVARANSMLGFIKRWTVDINDTATIKILYYAYVRSQVEYAVMVWCPFYDEYIRKIENIQKKFIRYLTWKDGWPYDRNLPHHLNLMQLPPYLTSCRSYNITSLQNRRELLKCSFVGNILLDQVDAPSILESFTLNAPCRHLRDRDFLHIKKHRTNYGGNEPINMMSKSFNTIYHLFDFCISKDSFKRKLKQYFTE